MLKTEPIFVWFPEPIFVPFPQTERSDFRHSLYSIPLLLQNTDRRRRVTRKILSKYLNDDELVQYDSFLVNLIKYITDLKETEQRIQLGEEQLVALNDNLNISTWNFWKTLKARWIVFVASKNAGSYPYLEKLFSFRAPGGGRVKNVSLFCATFWTQWPTKGFSCFCWNLHFLPSIDVWPTTFSRWGKIIIFFSLNSPKIAILDPKRVNLCPLNNCARGRCPPCPPDRYGPARMFQIQ